MTRSDGQRIADIIDACGELDTVVALRAAGSTSELVLVRAAERLLEIIGETASNVSEEVKDHHPDVDWRSLARLRVVLAHHYHRTDPSLIWTYAADEAPRLVAALTT